MTLAKQTKAASRSTGTPASLTKATELLKTLVGFDTTSAKSNLELIAFVEEYLKHHRIGSLRVPSPDGTKADLFATIGGSGDGGVGLSGHSDCVPVEGQNWTSDPFTLTEREGKLYARGACDMKGFIACVLASVPLFKERKLKEPVHLIVSYDEEVGCTGVRPLIARLGRDLPRPRAIIVGEPTSMAVIDAHKRIDAYRTTVHGREAHSSLPALGVNAISAAASLIGELDRIGANLAKSENDRHFDPPCSTINVGVIEGGTVPNVVPKTCDFHWQVRSLPSASPEEIPHDLVRFAEAELLPEMKKVTAEARIETKSVEFRSGFRRGQRIRGRGARAEAHRHERHAGRVLHDRGRAVRAGRMPRRDLRARRHRASACRG